MKEVRPSSGGEAASGRARRRPRWLIALLATVLLAAVVGGTTLAWERHRWPARLVAELPAVPDLGDRPAELRKRIEHARALLRDRARALAGVEELGRLYHANGFAGEAAACWRLLQAEQPDEARWTYYLADLQRAANDYAGMAELLARTTELAPDYAPAWLKLGDHRFKLGQLDDAARAYAKRLELLPGDPHARLGLARIALQQGQRDAAREQLEQLVKDEPMFPPARNLLAEVLAAAGEVERAQTERSLGSQAGRFREAGDPWLDELVSWCYDYEQLCHRGTVDLLTRHGDRGKALFERAIRLRPRAFSAYELLGNMYLDINDAARACEAYEQGLQQAQDIQPSAKFYADFSRAQRLSGNAAEAVRIAREGLARAGEDAGLYTALGLALRELGDREAAVEVLRRAEASQPDDPDTHYQLATALIAARRLDEAVAALHRSLAARPTFAPTLALLAQIEIDSGRWQGAIQYLQPLYDANPELPEAREKMAYAHLRAGAEAEAGGDFAAAEHHYRAGLAIAPERAELQARLGALLLIQRRFADAVAPLEAYHRQESGNAQSALFLGQAYAAVGRSEEAKRVLARGVELAESAGNATTAQHCREILRQLP